MKREHEALAEGDEDVRRQQAFAALVHAGYDSFEGMMREIPELVHAFRFHPWRLLRLMATSQALRLAIERAAAQNPRLWYECCLYAFPDFVIQLYLGEQKFDHYLPERAWGHMTALTRWCFTLWNVEHQLEEDEYGPHFDYRVQDCLDALAAGRVTALYAGEGHIDSSFHEQALLRACAQDAEVARQTARAFRVLCPFGLPPAQYCFASQVLLRQYALEFLDLLSDGDLQRGALHWLNVTTVDRLLRELSEGYLLIPWISDTHPFLRRRLSRISLSDCQAFLLDGSLRATGVGPRSVDERYDAEERIIQARDTSSSPPLPEKKGRGYQVELTLWELATKIEEFKRRLIAMGNNLTLPAVDDLQRQVMSAHLFHCSDAELERTLAQLADTNDLDYDALDSVRAAAEKERQARLEKYGALDPLYWRVLLVGGEDAYDPGVDWRTVCGLLIDIGKRMGRESDFYKSMEATLLCAHCGRSGVRFVEPTGALHAYCDQRCRDNHVIQ